MSLTLDFTSLERLHCRTSKPSSSRKHCCTESDALSPINITTGLLVRNAKDGRPCSDAGIRVSNTSDPLGVSTQCPWARRLPCAVSKQVPLGSPALEATTPGPSCADAQVPLVVGSLWVLVSDCLTGTCCPRWPFGSSTTPNGTGTHPLPPNWGASEGRPSPDHCIRPRPGGGATTASAISLSIMPPCFFWAASCGKLSHGITK